MSQESEGLLSPFLRHRRCSIAASHLEACLNILDLGSGTGFLSSFLPPTLRYTGIDSACGVDDVSSPQLQDRVLVLHGNVLQPSADLLGLVEKRGPFDGLAAVAFLEHVKTPAAAVRPFLRFLKPDAVFVATTPHPSGRRVHDMLSRVGVCSRGAAEEHEAFLDRDTLRSLGGQLGKRMLLYRRFLFGLNQLAVFR